MAESSSSSEPLSPDRALPPVQPPSAGFIVQLFLVPGLIVLVIVLVWLLFNWLAQMGSDPATYIDALKRNDDTRWHAAVNLAGALRGSGHEKIKSDPRVASDLAAVLQTEIETGGGLTGGSDASERSINLRIFLARALGEFYVPEAMPALLKAASTQRTEAESQVRVAAIEALAVLAENIRNVSGRPLESSELTNTLLEASRDEDAVIRSKAAFTLGVVGGPKATERLELLAQDGVPDVRYNAATGLARHGDEAAVPVLVEMLEPEQTAALELESGTREDRMKEARQFKQALIHVNAIRATLRLAEANPAAQMKPVTSAIQRLSRADVPQEVRVEARSALASLETLAENKR